MHCMFAPGWCESVLFPSAAISDEETKPTELVDRLHPLIVRIGIEHYASTGLQIRTGANESIWRPARNPETLQVSSFVDENPKGFGLMQRARSYADFEETVKHLDLHLCPGGVPKPEEGFCRLALQGSDVLIYEFRHAEGGPCLVQVHRHDFNAFVAQYGVNYTRP